MNESLAPVLFRFARQLARIGWKQIASTLESVQSSFDLSNAVDGRALHGAPSEISPGVTGRATEPAGWLAGGWAVRLTNNLDTLWELHGLLHDIAT